MALSDFTMNGPQSNHTYGIYVYNNMYLIKHK
jgi:hypothetical protein